MSPNDGASPALIPEVIGLLDAHEVSAELAEKTNQLTREFHQRVSHAIASAQARWRQSPPSQPAVRVDYSANLPSAVKDEIILELKAQGWTVGDIAINEGWEMNALVLIPPQGL